MAAKHQAENRARPGAGSIPWPEPRPLPWPGSGQGTHGSHWWRAQFGSPARIREWAAQELTNGRLLPWFAVAYGAGVILYFTAEREPALWAAVVPAAACALGDAIAPNVYDALFVSGIGHVLSISGYHMAVVAGVIFFIVRAFFALIPRLAGRAPIKKWAALAALVTGFYHILSGNQVATQRSFIMIGVVLLSVLFDRPALTMRTLTIAALVVLVRAGIGRASEFPDVVCRNARPDRRL